VPHMKHIFNKVVKQGFLKKRIKSLIFHIFKCRDQNDLAYYWTIIINPLLEKLFGMILERKLDNGLMIIIKVMKDKLAWGIIMLPLITLASLEFSRIVEIEKKTSSIVLLILENPLTLLRAKLWKRKEEIDISYFCFPWKK